MPTTEVLQVDPANPDPRAIERAAACLRDGGLVAFPTETVYGLGAHALNESAVARIFTAKGRPSNDPLIVHVAHVDDVPPLVEELPAVARTLAARFWPGPLTLVLPKSTAVPDAVSAGLRSVGVRVPIHPVARALLEAARLPVAAPSANLFSRPSPTRAQHVLDDLNGRIDIVLDGGPTTVGLESTVLDLSTATPTVLRPGAVSVEALRALLGAVATRDVTHAMSDGSSMTAPGQLLKHYSPRAPLTLYMGADDDAVRARIAHDAQLARDAGQQVGILDFSAERDLNRVAAQLFATLRDLDASGVDLILARAIARVDGLGPAIQDRLRRAAAGRIVQV